jgi:cytochrome P450
MIREGYHKYKGTPFKVANLDRWQVIVSGPQAVEELRQAPDGELSFAAATREILAVDYTLGSNIQSDPYHVPIIRNQLTKNLDILVPDILDEIVQAFDDEIHPTADWTKVSVKNAVMQIVCRTSNRVFVGLPLCRNPDWLALNVEFTIDVIKGALIINLAPKFLKPIVGRLFTNVRAKVSRGMGHLAPIIADRQRHIMEYGKTWDGKPNDVLSWFMENASEVEMSTPNLTRRILAMNFSAIHTSTMSFIHALYDLAAMPHYLQPLREEVEAVVNTEGWTKAAISKLRKVDSFLKESQRLNGLSCHTMSRTAVKDFTFTNGTFIPKGTMLHVAATVHKDDENYTNPDIFDGFRFANMDVPEDDDGKQRMVSTSLSFLAFGHGRHACPGRFFATLELKVMMAHLVLNYDIKLENEGIRPPNMWFASACVPNQKAKVLFRKRQS